VLDVSLAVTNPQFGDHDPVEWDSYRPEQYPVHGIDVSKWQGDIDWRTAKRGGVAFAFIKVPHCGRTSALVYAQCAKRPEVPAACSGYGMEPPIFV